ncbi:MAG: hypothetical protein MI757_19490, partial [Pirellulales bacterium]|nr:hypothetical protein [Pirellulales bacterium]
MSSSESQAATPTSQPKVVRWWRDYPLLIFFVVVWVLPLGWRGVVRNGHPQGLRDRLPHEVAHRINQRVDLPSSLESVIQLPREVNHLHNASCLYEKSPKSWWTYHVQGTVNGRIWFTLADDQYSPLVNFGRRARVDRLLTDVGAWSRKHTRYRRLGDEVCRWYRDRYSTLHPHATPLSMVRIVGIRYEVGESHIATPKGRWQKREPEDVDDRR